MRAYAYTGLDPDNENQRNFHDFLRRSNYKVVSKDIRKYGDGKVKANLDIELVVDMMKTARNLDIAIVVSGDGDFAPAIRAVQEMGVRVRGHQLPRQHQLGPDRGRRPVHRHHPARAVEKGSSRSGRRVADDDEDLSMTEVPDKQTEGTGIGRGRGTRGGRTRTTRVGEPEPVAAAPRAAARGVRRAAEPAPLEVAASAAPIAVSSYAGGLVALPGEKLSKAAIAAAARVAAAVPAPVAVPVEPEFELDIEEEEILASQAQEGGADGDGTSEDGQRRRRRRGGRGRGRGRGRLEGEPMAGTVAPTRAQVREPVREPVRESAARPLDLDDEEDEEDIPVAPRPPRSAAFGSFWDSQIGMDKAPAANLSPLDIDDEDEPAIPEYLIAEQRRGNRPVSRDGRRTGGGIPNRGGRSSGYSAAVDRERYGRGGGGGGINRYPDVSARRPDDRPRDDRPVATPRVDRPRGGDEPWSEVPPELEAMLRAQIAAKPGRPAQDRPSGRSAQVAAPVAEAAPRTDAEAGSAPAAARRGRPAKVVAPAAVEATAAAAAVAPAPKRRVTTRRAAEPATIVAEPVAAAEPTATRRRAPAKAKAEAAPVAAVASEAAPAPKRRTAKPAAAAPLADPVADAAAAPKRRATRKVAE